MNILKDADFEHNRTGPTGWVSVAASVGNRSARRKTWNAAERCRLRSCTRS